MAQKLYGTRFPLACHIGPTTPRPRVTAERSSGGLSGGRLGWKWLSHLLGDVGRWSQRPGHACQDLTAQLRLSNGRASTRRRGYRSHSEGEAVGGLESAGESPPRGSRRTLRHTGRMHLEMASRVPRRPPAGRCATLGVGGSRPRWSLAGEPLRRPPLTSSELAMVSHRGEHLRPGFSSLLKCSGRRIRPPRLGRGWPWQRLICASEGSPSEPRPTTTRASPKPMAATEPLAVMVARIPHRLAREEVVQRTLGPRQVASWPLATTAGARPLT